MNQSEPNTPEPVCPECAINGRVNCGVHWREATLAGKAPKSSIAVSHAGKSITSEDVKVAMCPAPQPAAVDVALLATDLVVIASHSPTNERAVELVAKAITSAFATQAERINQETIRQDDLLFHLKKRGYEVGGLDGDESPAEIVASWFDGEMRELKEQLACKLERASADLRREIAESGKVRCDYSQWLADACKELVQKGNEVVELREQLAAAQKDSARLDWFSKQPLPTFRYAFNNKPPMWCVSPDGLLPEYERESFRDAIDAAMSKDKT